MFGKDLLIKSVVSMATGYFKKNPDKDIRVTIPQIVDYISKNYPDFQVKFEKVNGEDTLILSAKNG